MDALSSSDRRCPDSQAQLNCLLSFTPHGVFNGRLELDGVQLSQDYPVDYEPSTSGMALPFLCTINSMPKYVSAALISSSEA